MVRCVKFVLSAGVWLWDVVRFSVMRCFGKAPPGRAVILYYHGIPDEAAAKFTAQMDALLQRAKPVAAGWQGDLPPGSLQAAVTFDDGFVSVLRNALPVLEKRGIPATIFVPSGYVGALAGWIKNPTFREGRGMIMDRDQLLAALRHPSVTIGSHTITHPRLDRLGEAELARELVESRRSLEDLLGCTVSLFSFPHGIYTLKALEVARSAGYSRVFGIQPSCAQQRLNAFVMGRVLVTPEDWPLEFALKLRGAYRWLARRNADLREPAPIANN
jgi:peptidoglycan/xylan/chitin deacetylase (PgdA/CDA1 family)